MNRRQLIWALFVVAWTTALLTPIYLDLPDGDIRILIRGISSKTLHVVCYALMTALTGWLKAPPRTRLLLLFFVMAHGAVTEALQQFVPGRGGAARDVCLDHLGVLAGLYWSWNWWMAKEAPAYCVRGSGAAQGAAHAVSGEANLR